MDIRSYSSFSPAAAVLLIALSGCAAVGPDYVEPAPALPASWSNAAIETPVAPIAGRDDLSRWWDRFEDPVLSQLVAEALRGSPDLRIARARLREARARRAAAGAQLAPSAGARASASANRRGTDPATELYSAGFDASWELDVFGGARRGLQAADADAQAAAWTLEATRVSLAAEVARNYVDVRAFQSRLAIARGNLATQSETLQLTEWRAQAGLVGSLDVEQARANREQTSAQIPTLQTGFAEAEHRLAVLLGLPPAALRARLAPAAPIPSAPAQLALGIPADVLRQRPDVRAAERTLAAETARIGQAEAARYPGFKLSGSIGLEALALDSLTAGSAVTRSLLAGLTAPVFDAGRLRQQVEAQRAVQERAAAGFESAVLTALEEVENALVGLRNSRARQAALSAALGAARNAALLARHRYLAGLMDFQTVLDTERSVLSFEDGLASSEADGALALVQLYKALGGGWTAGAETTPSGASRGAAARVPVSGLER